MYGIGRAEAARVELHSIASSYTAGCVELHSKKAWAPFRSLDSNSHTSFLAVRVRDLISASLQAEPSARDRARPAGAGASAWRGVQGV